MTTTDPLLRPHQPLAGKTVLLGVSGGIAAYKAADLASNLVQLGADVHVLMTSTATSFIAPGTFAALTQNQVHDNVLERWHQGFAGHITLAQTADAFIIAPATANTLANLSLGLANEIIGTTALATYAPLLLAPAMEHAMFHHPATQQHLATLTARGATIIGPESGRLASGEYGDGRLAPVTDLTGAVRKAIGQSGVLAGKRITVTAGGTHERLDPVRFLGNGSSGRMGYAIAQAAIDLGADVTLISGPTALPYPYGMTVIPIESADEMYTAVQEQAKRADAIVMTAAVADFRPEQYATEKIKKTVGKDVMQLDLVRNPDIIGSLKAKSLLKIGFAAETNNHLENGRAKLSAKGLDMVIVNDAAATIGAKVSQATILTADAEPEPLPLMTKERLAAEIVQRMAELIRQ
ncbi:MAG TPA: bifunctional phosphopantothenoylcysteine decarboxylase/phosphopantothenate--cysteine ligase CoaBC [Thermomicrobiales bacterium]|nr:bifunctional phosphopantothenoylcysteine decarboxylase/phosphopantothenate--cysteine ligase CoaBC [Thermomicrobiales bacterium]